MTRRMLPDYLKLIAGLTLVVLAGCAVDRVEPSDAQQPGQPQVQAAPPEVHGTGSAGAEPSRTPIVPRLRWSGDTSRLEDAYRIVTTETNWQCKPNAYRW